MGHSLIFFLVQVVVNNVSSCLSRAQACTEWAACSPQYSATRRRCCHDDEPPDCARRCNYDYACDDDGGSARVLRPRTLGYGSSGSWSHQRPPESDSASARNGKTTLPRLQPLMTTAPWQQSAGNDKPARRWSVAKASTKDRLVVPRGGKLRSTAGSKSSANSRQEADRAKYARRKVDSGKPRDQSSQRRTATRESLNIDEYDVRAATNARGGHNDAKELDQYAVSEYEIVKNDENEYHHTTTAQYDATGTDNVDGVDDVRAATNARGGHNDAKELDQYAISEYEIVKNDENEYHHTITPQYDATGTDNVDALEQTTMYYKPTDKGEESALSDYAHAAAASYRSSREGQRQQAVETRYPGNIPDERVVAITHPRGSTVTAAYYAPDHAAIDHREGLITGTHEHSDQVRATGDSTPYQMLDSTGARTEEQAGVPDKFEPTQDYRFGAGSQFATQTSTPKTDHITEKNSRSHEKMKSQPSQEYGLGTGSQFETQTSTPKPDHTTEKNSRSHEKIKPQPSQHYGFGTGSQFASQTSTPKPDITEQNSRSHDKMESQPSQEYGLGTGSQFETQTSTSNPDHTTEQNSRSHEKIEPQPSQDYGVGTRSQFATQTSTPKSDHPTEKNARSQDTLEPYQWSLDTDIDNLSPTANRQPQPMQTKGRFDTLDTPDSEPYQSMIDDGIDNRQRIATPPQQDGTNEEQIGSAEHVQSYQSNLRVDNPSQSATQTSQSKLDETSGQHARSPGDFAPSRSNPDSVIDNRNRLATGSQTEEDRARLCVCDYTKDDGQPSAHGPDAAHDNTNLCSTGQCTARSRDVRLRFSTDVTQHPRTADDCDRRGDRDNRSFGVRPNDPCASFKVELATRFHRDADHSAGLSAQPRCPCEQVNRNKDCVDINMTGRISGPAYDYDDEPTPAGENCQTKTLVQQRPLCTDEAEPARNNGCPPDGYVPPRTLPMGCDCQPESERTDQRELCVEREPLATMTETRASYVKHPIEPPIHHESDKYKPPVGTVNSLTETRAAYVPHQIPELFHHEQDKYIPPTGAVNSLTETRAAYVPHQIPELFHHEKDKYIPPTGVVNSLTETRAAYVPHQIPELFHHEQDKYIPPTGAVNSLTETRAAYVPHQIPELFHHEKDKYIPPTGAVNTLTETRAAYVPHQIPELFHHEKDKYIPPTGVVNSLTETRAAYVPHQIPELFHHEKDKYIPPTGAVNSVTETRAAYVPHQIPELFHHEQDKYIPPTGAVNSLTETRAAYVPHQIPELFHHEKDKYIPPTGAVNTLTETRAAYVPHQIPELFHHEKDKYIPPTGVVNSLTETRAAYVPHQIPELFHHEKDKYIPPTGVVNSLTETRAAYVPHQIPELFHHEQDKYIPPTGTVNSLTETRAAYVPHQIPELFHHEKDKYIPPTGAVNTLTETRAAYVPHQIPLLFHHEKDKYIPPTGVVNSLTETRAAYVPHQIPELFHHEKDKYIPPTGVVNSLTETHAAFVPHQIPPLFHHEQDKYIPPTGVVNSLTETHAAFVPHQIPSLFHHEPEKYKPPAGTMNSITETRATYVSHPIPAIFRREPEKYEPGKCNINSTTTYRKQFDCKATAKAKPVIPKPSQLAACKPFTAVTTQRNCFQPQAIEVREQTGGCAENKPFESARYSNAKPASGPFDDDATYTAEYRQCATEPRGGVGSTWKSRNDPTGMKRAEAAAPGSGCPSVLAGRAMSPRGDGGPAGGAPDDATAAPKPGPCERQASRLWLNNVQSLNRSRRRNAPPPDHPTRPCYTPLGAPSWDGRARRDVDLAKRAAFHTRPAAGARPRCTDKPPHQLQPLTQRPGCAYSYADRYAALDALRTEKPCRPQPLVPLQPIQAAGKPTKPRTIGYRCGKLEPLAPRTLMPIRPT